MLTTKYPATEIPSVVRSLVQSPPSKQHRIIETYFRPNASFTFPLCRTGSWELSRTVNSRLLIVALYRWYKIMSPHIDLSINSVGTSKYLPTKEKKKTQQDNKT